MTALRVLVIACTLSAACTKVEDVFTCATDEQCRAGGADGRCEPSGYCSLPASDCASSWRYDRSAAAELAGQCTPAVDCAAPWTPAGGDAIGTCIDGAAPVVDGDLADWPDALFTTAITHATAAAAGGTWSADEATNDQDLSARVAWRWDASYLFVAAKVDDDQLIARDEDTPLWENDTFELFLDGEADLSGPYGEHDHQVIVRHDGIASSRRDRMQVPLPLGILFARSLTATGWQVELAVPFATLGDQPPTTGRRVGVDIVLEDREEPDLPAIEQHLTWKKADPVPAACADTCPTSCLPSCSTLNFGVLQLGGS